MVLHAVLPYQIAPDEHSGAVMSFMEITELKKSRDALEDRNRSLQDAQEIAGMGDWELDLAGNRLHWSKTIYDIFEVDPKTFRATYDAFLERVHPEDRDRLNEAYQQSVKEKKPYDMVHRILMKDGRIKHVHEICRTEYTPDGRPIRSLGIVQDVTRQKQLETRLAESESRYRTLFDTISSGVAVYKAVDGGKDFEFVDFNSSAEEIEQIRRDELIGKRIGTVFSGNSGIRSAGGSEAGVDYG